jgi:hypothetical protein
VDQPVDVRGNGDKKASDRNRDKKAPRTSRPSIQFVSHDPILASAERLTPSRNGNELHGPLHQPPESARIEGMGRQFQFSLGRLFLATSWLSLAAWSLGNLAHTHSDRLTVVATTFIGMLVGIAGAIGALTGTAALRHSVYSAGAALAVGLAMIAIFAQVRPSPMGTKAFVALLSGIVLAVAWLVVRSRRRSKLRPATQGHEEG